MGFPSQLPEGARLPAPRAETKGFYYLSHSAGGAFPQLMNAESKITQGWGRGAGWGPPPGLASAIASGVPSWEKLKRYGQNLSLIHI